MVGSLKSRFVDVFPKQKLFWALHCSGLAAMAVTQVAANVQSTAAVPYFVMAGQVLWLPYFTFAMLGVRWFYKRQQWQAKPIVKQIIVVVMASLLAALTLVLMTVSSMWLLFLPDALAYSAKVAPNLSIIEVLQRSIFRNFTVAAPHALAWCFIYVSVGYWRRVKEAELNALKQQNSLKEAKLANLSGQLNPHFLFNALNNIRFLIHENANKAEDALTTLSEVLRHSLMTNTAEKITLESELEFVEKYLQLTKLQLENRLLDKLQVSQQVKHCLVPPLMLQMLVENAIKHGVEHMHPAGRLHVDIDDINGSQLSIKVCNDKPSQENELVTKLGIGLNNIQSRLQLMYGDAADMTVEPSAGLFCVHIKLPMEWAR